jgi:hypothetical protein
MNYKITELDKRHAWHKQFAYMIEFQRRKDWDHKSTGGVLEFDQCRKWFNETWGWSQDVETREEMIRSITKSDVVQLDQVNFRWSYSIRYGEYRIYVDELAMTMFRLKWSQDAVA